MYVSNIAYKYVKDNLVLVHLAELTALASQCASCSTSLTCRNGGLTVHHGFMILIMFLALRSIKCATQCLKCQWQWYLVKFFQVGLKAVKSTSQRCDHVQKSRHTGVCQTRFFCFQKAKIYTISIEKRASHLRHYKISSGPVVVSPFW